MNELLIGIATYQSKNRLAGILHDIWKSSISYVDVLVCDDCSPSQSIEISDIAHEFGACYYRHPENLGCPAAYNTISQMLRHKYVLLLDDDVRIPPNFIEHVLYVLKNNPHLGVAGWKSYKLEKNGKLEWHGYVPPTDPEPTTELAGYCFAYQRETWKKVGGFCEDYKYYCSDSDFCVSAAKHGLYSYRLSYPLVAHAEHMALNECPELRAAERLESDRKVFTNRHGFESTAHAEKALLGGKEIPPLRWLSPTGATESIAKFVSRI